MGKITIYGWNIGFNKVAHTKLQRVELGYSVSRAKSITDAVADLQLVIIQVADQKTERLAFEMNELGAKCKVDKNDGVQQGQIDTL